ncbi:MAG: hypothetical protein JO112_05050, partial [Planctomycetes bacterium]|nr:hypothetical protein [Planctomycetota bacterium]
MRRLLAGFWATLVLSCLSTAALAQPPAPVHDTGNPLVEPGPQEAGVTDPGEGSHFTAGGGVFLLRAFPGNDTAFNSFASTQTNSFFTGSSSTTSSVSTVTEFHHGFEVAPLVWLGYVSDSGLGGRVRWWRFAEDTSLGAFLPAASPLVGDLTRTVSLHAAPFDQLALDA